MSLRVVLVLTLASVTHCYSQASMTPDAQYDLGVRYYWGQGVPQDYVQAAAWFRKAADRGYAPAQIELGLMYFTGQGVPQDYSEATRWYRKAADQGNAEGQYNLGVMYDLGLGVPQDYAEALRWYRNAADQGNALAQHNVGVMYSTGQGVPQDYSEATRWYRKAADQGRAGSQYNLGVMYDLGLGVPQDYVQAYMWLNLASARDTQRSYYATKRDGIAEKMSREQIAQAQEMARNWQPKTAEESFAENRANAIGPSLKPESTGTGFFVSRKGYLLTNYHVIDGCVSLRADINRGETLTVMAQDEGNDLAVLKSMQTISRFATFSSSPVRVGQSVMAVGYPLRGLLSSGANATTGNVSALAGPNDDTSLLQITAPVQPGNSGGPLLDQSGNVIGVVVSKLDTLRIARATGDIPQNVNFAIKGTVVRSFLEANGVEFSTAASTGKLDPTVIAERATKSTVVVECWK